MYKTLAERLRDCAQGLNLGADGMGWSPDPELLKQAADNIDGLHAELKYARDGLTKGRTRMREDNERMRAALVKIEAGMCIDPRTVARDALGPNASLSGGRRPSA